jgi:hypothetical protein
MKTDQKLARSQRDHFEDPVLVLGDWSASNTRYHELIRGKDMRKMLKQHGFLVYLIHEFRACSCCPTCHNCQPQEIQAGTQSTAIQATSNISCNLPWSPKILN